MRYAIISDIHSNIEALQVILEEIDRCGVDQVICLGDVVGYNANPNECAGLLVEKEIPSLMGNHDAVVCDMVDPLDFNPIAKKAILWTKETVEEKYKDFLFRQPAQRKLTESVRLVHGSIINRDQYLLSRNTIMENIDYMRNSDPEVRILFFGHTHNQIAFSYNNETLSVISSPRFTLKEDGFYLINPGSVGQPRDQDPRSAFLIYDEDARTVEFIRLSYDIQTCKQKIISAKLPQELANRLDQGW